MIRYLAELEMKLHLGSEDISLYLQDQAARATQRIPTAARELARIREDAQGVRTSVANTLSKLQADSSRGSTAATLASLEEIDGVKQRMEDACSTLKEAAGLSTLFSLVDDLFASGDLPRTADALAGIRRGLAVVADSVPEFRDGRQRLARLEDRFSAAAEVPLAAALSTQQGDQAARLVGMLVAMGRQPQIATAYTAARSVPLWSLWEGYTPGTPFVSWLSTFYDQVLHSVAAECRWCSTSLADQYPDLVLSLLSSFFASIEKPHGARLAGALTGAPGSLLPLEHLEQAAAAVADFVNGLRRELIAEGSWSPQRCLSLLGQVVAPVEGALLQYHDKELQYLTAELPRLLAPVRDAATSPHALPAAIGDSVDPAFGAVTAAVARCLRVTGGTALPALARVLDRVLQQYITAVQTAIGNVHMPKQSSRSDSPTKKTSPGTVTSPAAATGDKLPSFGGPVPSPELVVPLLMIIARIKDRLQECIASIEHAATSTITEVLGQPAPIEIQEVDAVTLTALRLQAQPTLRQQLSSFLPSTSAPLPYATAATGEISFVVERFVERALCGRVEGYLAAVPSLAEWKARPATSVQLPSFTPYPLQYITATGEYLMMLPQLLESALASDSGGGSNPGTPVVGGTTSLHTSGVADGEQMGEEGEAEGGVASQLVAAWVDRAALSSSQLYLDQLQRIKGLTAQGAGQLAADIEYFSNVLSTLGLAVSPVMAAWQAALEAPDAAALEGLRGLAAGEGGSSEVAAAVIAVARLRRIELGAGAGTPYSAQ